MDFILLNHITFFIQLFLSPLVYCMNKYTLQKVSGIPSCLLRQYQNGSSNHPVNQTHSTELSALSDLTVQSNDNNETEDQHRNCFSNP